MISIQMSTSSLASRLACGSSRLQRAAPSALANIIRTTRSSPSFSTSANTSRTSIHWFSTTSGGNGGAGAHASGPTSTNTETHFGFRNVNVNEKENLVRGVFDSVAESYDVMNDLMSVGIHRLWKDCFVSKTRVHSLASEVRRHQHHQANNNNNQQELRILDVAGGTGDIAFRMIDAMQCEERAKSSGRDPVSVTVCDINTEMLRVGQRRAQERYGGSALFDTKALSFQEGNAQSLDDPTVFPNNHYDLYTIAFGLRNVTDVDAALREANRVLKPGGRFMCLEFSHLPHPVLQSLYDTYSFQIIPALGEFVANDRESYQYLVESIRKFSNQETLVQRMEQAGFEGSRYTNLTGGIVAIHEGWKPVIS